MSPARFLYIAASTHLEAQRLEMERRLKNQQQVQEAFRKTASPQGLAKLFPGLKLKK